MNPRKSLKYLLTCFFTVLVLLAAGENGKSSWLTIQKAADMAKAGDVCALYLLGDLVTVELPPQHQLAAAGWNPSRGKSGLSQNELSLAGVL